MGLEIGLSFQIKRDENGVPLPLPLQNIQNIHLDGLKFIILNTAPASFNDFPFLISLKEKEPSLGGSSAIEPGSSLDRTWKKGNKND